MRVCAHLWVPEEKCLLQEGVDVAQRGVVHEETQAGLEVTGNDCQEDKVQWRSVKVQRTKSDTAASTCNIY